MIIEDIEAQVLALPRDSQTVLLARLLKHLGESDEIDQEVASVWLEQAELRDQAIDDGKIETVPAEQVFQRIRASFQ